MMHLWEIEWEGVEVCVLPLKPTSILEHVSITQAWAQVKTRCHVEVLFTPSCLEGNRFEFLALHVSITQAWAKVKKSFVYLLMPWREGVWTCSMLETCVDLELSMWTRVDHPGLSSGEELSRGRLVDLLMPWREQVRISSFTRLDHPGLSSGEEKFCFLAHALKGTCFNL